MFLLMASAPGNHKVDWHYGTQHVGLLWRQCYSSPYNELCYSLCLALPWRHNWCDGVPDRQPRDCLLNRSYRRRSKKTPKLCVTGLCTGNSPGTGEFPAQMASNAENVSIWWRHHGDAIWQWSSGSTFAQVMACCLADQWWLPISEVL